jgi:hypothetical protein
MLFAADTDAFAPETPVAEACRVEVVPPSRPVIAALSIIAFTDIFMMKFLLVLSAA